jgi:cytochrome c-type biogenesis protein
MLDRVLTTLSGLIDAAAAHPLPALGAAFAWGVASVALSPCHLAGIPLLVGFISSRGKLGVGRTWLLSGVFSLGVLLTIALVGVLTWAAGRMLGDVGGWMNYAMAAVFIGVGLYLLDAVRVPWSVPEQAGLVRRGGLWSALLLGLVFGLALGPCTFAYMAPVLGVVFKSSSSSPLLSAGLLAVYAAAHCGVIALAGASAGLVQKVLDWHDASHGAKLLKKICGALVIAAALYLIYKA